MSVIVFDPHEIRAAGAAVTASGEQLAGTPPVPSPPLDAFGKLLEPAARHTFPSTTDDLASWIEDSSHAVVGVGEGLELTAEAYGKLEEWAVRMVQPLMDAIDDNQVTNGDSLRPTSITLPPRERWQQAAEVLAEGSAAGGDSFARGSLATVLVPAPIEWLDVPATATEMVNTCLGFLAATVVSYFPPFDDALDQVAGNSAAVRELRAQFDALAPVFVQQASEMGDAMNRAPRWTGPAADAFHAYVGDEQSCMRAATQLLEVLGPSVEGVAGNTAAARKAIIAIIASILEAIISYVSPRILWLQMALGLVATPLTFPLGAAGLAALLMDFIAWLLDFLATEMTATAQLLRDIAGQGMGYLGQVRQLGESLRRAGIILETGQDPGNGYGVDPDSMAASMYGTAPDERDGLLVDLMAHCIPPGMSEVTDPAALAELGLSPEMLRNDDNGFIAHVYQDKDGNDIVLFEGTDFEDPAQTDLVQENVPGATGMGPQSEMAMAIAQAIGDSAHGGEVVYTGHSLGGRLAAIASMTSGSPAVTANAAGVSPATMDYIAQQNGMTYEELVADVNNGMIRAYRTEDDILTGLQEKYPITPGLMPPAPGTRLELGGEQNPVAGHAASNVLLEYNQRHGQERPGTLTP